MEKFNQKFGTKYEIFKHTEENVESCYNIKENSTTKELSPERKKLIYEEMKNSKSGKIIQQAVDTYKEFKTYAEK
jgi:hypothetical protein